MNRLALPFACAASLVAAGCAMTLPDLSGPPEAPPPPVFAPGECDGEAAQFAVGKSFNTPLVEEARARTRAERVRTVRPGQMITMEFDARRLTIELDGDGRIVRARCG